MNIIYTPARGPPKMASTTSYTNLIAFLLTTLFYYLALKPSLKLPQIQDPQLYESYTSASYKYLAIYFLIVLIIQFIINISVITNMCGGAVTQNVAYSGFITFFPWTLIFGVLIVVLALNPGFRKVFADVYGYFFISSSANRILTELLINKDIQSKIDQDASIPAADKERMQSAADMIVKICGNTGVLINQLTPTNFMEYWGLLKPLMKAKYAGGTTAEAQDLQTRLFELVVTKTNVGEATWYIYTGILLTSLVQLKISTRGCQSNSATQQANYKAFLEKEKAAADQKAQATNTVYTITS